MTDAALASELVALAAEDQRVRSELLAEGVLFDGYHPSMEMVHRANAARLGEVLARVGWPGASMVGDDAATAAWTIAQHAIGEPAFQRACLAALERAAEAGEVPAWQPAMLEDRIRVFEGRPQRFGTQLEVDDEGRLRPHFVEDPDGVEDRRRRAGLDPLADTLARAERVPPPKDRARFESDYQAWLRAVGWRS